MAARCLYPPHGCQVPVPPSCLPGARTPLMSARCLYPPHVCQVPVPPHVCQVPVPPSWLPGACTPLMAARCLYPPHGYQVPGQILSGAGPDARSRCQVVLCSVLWGRAKLERSSLVIRAVLHERIFDLSTQISYNRCVFKWTSDHPCIKMTSAQFL